MTDHLSVRDRLRLRYGPVRRSIGKRFQPLRFKEHYIQSALPATGTYLEIGVRNGDSFRSVDAAEKLGVDPLRRAPMNQLRPNERFFEMTSDDFFQMLPVSGLPLLARGIDVALVDGLHAYRQVVRDISNCAQYASPHGVIVLDDCNPATPQAAAPTQCPGLWNGDVWKAMALMVELLPPEDAITIDADQGVGLIRIRRPLVFEDEDIRRVEELTYRELETNRQQILRLRPPKSFEAWLGE